VNGYELPDIFLILILSTWTKVFRYFTPRSRRFATRRTLLPGCKPGKSDAGKLMAKYLNVMLIQNDYD